MGNATPSLPRRLIGIDIIEIPRIAQAIARWHDSFLTRVYTTAELEYCHNAIPSLAARFAAKEATMKALGIGMKGLSWRDIEVLSNADGAPSLRLHGRALKKSKEAGVTELSITLSHSKQHAIAFVICDAV
jgi:holo-[acyl-carrier protein] synthase